LANAGAQIAARHSTQNGIEAPASPKMLIRDLAAGLTERSAYQGDERR
jgi:hypothetical protein